MFEKLLEEIKEAQDKIKQSAMYFGFKPVCVDHSQIKTDLMTFIRIVRDNRSRLSRSVSGPPVYIIAGDMLVADFDKGRIILTVDLNA